MIVQKFVGKNVVSTQKFVGKNVVSTQKFVGKNVVSTQKFVGKNVVSTQKFVGKSVVILQKMVGKSVMIVQNLKVISRSSPLVIPSGRECDRRREHWTRNLLTRTFDPLVFCKRSVKPSLVREGVTVGDG